MLRVVAIGLMNSPYPPGDRAMSFALYIIGFVIVIVGVAWALIAAHVSTLYVMITCVILLGVGILTGVTKMRSKDTSA